MFSKGTFSGRDFHFSLWVWCDWQGAQSPSVACTDVKKKKKSQLGQSLTTTQWGNSQKPNLSVWCDGLCISSNFHISYNTNKWIRDNDLIWRENTKTLYLHLNWLWTNQLGQSSTHVGHLVCTNLKTTWPFKLLKCEGCQDDIIPSHCKQSCPWMFFTLKASVWLLWPIQSSQRLNISI